MSCCGCPGTEEPKIESSSLFSPSKIFTGFAFLCMVFESLAGMTVDGPGSLDTVGSGGAMLKAPENREISEKFKLSYIRILTSFINRIVISISSSFAINTS